METTSQVQDIDKTNSEYAPTVRMARAQQQAETTYEEKVRRMERIFGPDWLERVR